MTCSVQDLCISLKQDRQCTYNVTLRRLHETIVAVESNKYYIFLCVRVCARASTHIQARTCACARVGLLIKYATRRRHIVCVLSGSTRLFNIIS